MITSQTYTLSSTAWERGIWCPVGSDIREELLVGIETDEGWYGDFRFEWRTHGIVLHAFQDSWKAVSHIHDILADLDRAEVTPEELIEVLERCGFEPSVNHNQLLALEFWNVKDLLRRSLKGDEKAITELARRAKRDDNDV